MASLRGSTTLLDGDLDADTASGWAYVGSATDVTLYIDDGGTTANWTIEVAVGNGQPGLNGIDFDDPDAVPSAILLDRLGADYTIATTGDPVAINLSPFAAQYVRVRPDDDITDGSVSIATVARNSRSLRGHQVLWDDADVEADDASAAGFVGDETNAVLFLFAAGGFTIQVAAGTGFPGLNETPGESDWANLFDSNTGDPIGFAGTGDNQAIDLSPFGGNFIRLVATSTVSGVTATLAVTD